MLTEIYNFIGIFSNQYIIALLILAGFFFISKLIVYIFQNVFLKIAEKTKTKLDDQIIEKTNKPISLLLIGFGLRLAFEFLVFPDIIANFYGISIRIIESFIILICAYIVVRIVYVLIDFWDEEVAKKTKSHLDDALIVMFRKAAKIIIWAIVIVIILSRWDVEIGPILASLGVAGVAVAFALQSTLGNIFGGISLLIDKSVKVGDRIKLDNGESGIVMDVSLRSTRIKTWDNDIIIVPNGQLNTSILTNHISKDKKARVTVNFGVEYGVNIDNVEKVVVGAVKKIKECLNDPAPAVDFLEMGDSALLFKARFWVGDIKERYMAKVNATKNIYNALTKAKIGIPFPQMAVHIKK